MARESIPLMPEFDEQSFLAAIEPAAGDLLHTHHARAKEWFPHDYVPWSAGRDFTDEDPWTPDDYPLPDETASALFLNLLTEDNLPYYFHTIGNTYGNGGALGEWSRRWTAEEGRHSIVIRDFLTVARVLDPTKLERARMQQVGGGIVPEPETPPENIAYVTLQELATRVAHINTGKNFAAQEGRFAKAGHDIMTRVGADENLHYLFYSGLGKVALEQFPSLMMIAVERVVRNFNMPGTGVPDYEAHASRVAAAGIYNLGIFYEKVLVAALLKNWKIENVTGLSAEAEQSRDRTLAHMARVKNVAARLGQIQADKTATLGITS